MTTASTQRRFGKPKTVRPVILSALHPAHRSGRSIFPSRVFDPDEVARVLGFDRHRRPARLTIAQIQHETAAHFGVKLTDMLSARRTAGIVLPRHIAIWLAANHTDHSMPNIGRHFGGRDHSTIMHAIRRIDRMMATVDVAEAVRGIEARL
jgi:chromosomal replication initiation ATPase DnaA